MLNRKNRRLTRFLNFALTLIVFGGLQIVGSAQVDQARIAGTVRDQGDALVPGAAVTIRNERTGEIRNATANAEGRFIVTGLKASSYTITVTATGFAKTEWTNVELVVGQALDLDAELKPAGTTEVITIVGAQEASIDTSSARLGANVNEQEVVGLPLNGRQLSQLYLQAPGALNSGSGTFSDIRFSGRAVQQNAIRYDGVEGSAIIDASPGNLNGEIPSPFRLQASLENVQEFRVESNSYPAEYGTGTGGQVTVITKSGSNQFHGSVFEYHRNDALDARNTFDGATKSPLKLNQFGASLGGPITKEKFFFFGSYEGYRLRSGINFVEAVPSEAACAGAVPAIAPLCPEAFLGPNSVILGASPDPNFNIAQLQASNPVNENAGSLRLDYKWNDRNTIYARYFRDQGDNDQPQNVSGSRAVINATTQNGVLAWQSTLSQNKINEFKLGFNGARTRVFGTAPTINGIDLSAVTINITGSIANAGIGGQGSSSGITVPGGLVRANSATNGRSQPYTPYTVSFIDNLSWLKGNHNLKFGGEVRLLRMYTDRLGGTTYSYSNLAAFLNNTATVQYVADLSAPSPFNNGITGERFAKEEFFIGYAQDEFKVRPNLTVNYGLRYEYYTPLREDRNGQVVFDAVNGVILPSDTTIYKSLKTNFAPRVSFAWTPFAGGKLVLRGGFGINYGPGQIEDQVQPIESDRIVTTANIANAAFPADIPGFIDNFNTNPNDRLYQPRAYYQDRYRVPERIYSYSFSVQQELPYNMALTLAYVGSQGRNLFLRSITNQIIGLQGNSVIRQFDIVDPDGTIHRPYSEVDVKLSGGHDSYNALQAMLGRRFNSGLILNAQYTFAKSYGNTAGSNEALTVGNNAVDIDDFDYDNGYNNFDVRHMFNVSALYELPFGRTGTGLQKQLLGGWSIGTIANIRSGLPIDVRITRPDILYVDGAGNYFTSAGAGRTPVINTPGGGNTRNLRRPDVVAGVNPFLDQGRLILNPAAFAIPQPGTFGNLMRNALHGPNFYQFDLMMGKKFPITERFNVEFRSEIFNLFNLTNFANPNATLPNVFTANTVSPILPGQAFTSDITGNFGAVTRTVSRDVGLGAHRQIQFALRLNF